MATLEFRAVVAVIALVGMLILYATIFRNRAPTEDVNPPPTVPAGDQPPPSRL